MNEQSSPFPSQANPMEAPSLEQQIAMQKMQRHLEEAKERLDTGGYQPLEVVMTANGPMVYGVKFNLADDNNELDIVCTPLEETTDGAELPVELAMVQLEVVGMLEDHEIKQIVLVGMDKAERASVLETAIFMQEAQMAQQIGVELTMLLAAHKEGQVPAEALDNSKAKELAATAASMQATHAPGAKTTPGGIILP